MLGREAIVNRGHDATGFRSDPAREGLIHFGQAHAEATAVHPEERWQASWFAGGRPVYTNPDRMSGRPCQLMIDDLRPRIGLAESPSDGRNVGLPSGDDVLVGAGRLES